MKWLLFYLLFWGSTLPTVGRAVTPMEYFYNRVAGGDEAGFQDGTFAKARFALPTGLAFDKTGKKLFVADSKNNRIRIVDLLNENEVETLAGTGLPGNADGSFAEAAFNAPLRVTSLSNDRMAVYDQGNHLIRLLDLKAKTVSSVSGSVTIWDMVYSPVDDSLYFSEPDNRSIGKLDLKSLTVSTPFANNTLVPSPQALCLDQEKLYVADRALPTVYSLKLADLGSSDQKSLNLTEAGQGDHVLELAFSDGSLYALQSGVIPLVKVGSPKSTPVILPTVWGFLMDPSDPGAEPFLSFGPGQPVGFAASPVESRKFFVSTPTEGLHSIISLKDYDFGPYWKSATNSEPSGVAMDFSYPAKKPSGTYRILLAGDSRTYIGPRNVPGPPYDFDATYLAFLGTLRMDTMGKQLELFLNTEAALQGVKTHYEVLEWNRKDKDLPSYASYEIPPIVKKYDIDQVLALVSWAGYQDYYMRPMTSEGIPAYSLDTEFLLKPFSQRIPPGPAADLIERYKNRTKVDISKLTYPGQEDPWGFIHSADPEMRKDLIEMAGRRLQLMGEKIQAGLSPGKPAPKVTLFFVPYEPLHR
jgi:DNA-binding beta-propeller fold protein YncE